MTSPHTAAEAFADAASALVDAPDVTDILARLVADCAAILGAEAVAILARSAGGELSLLSASSHRATELELLQIQRATGPCVDVIATNEALRLTGEDRIRDRWKEVGDAIVKAGFVGVEAYPLRWRGTVLGGLNVFRSDEHPVGDDDPGVGQAFADIATLAVVCSTPISTEQAAARLQEALSARELVEQAKGVVAYVDDVDMSTAYDTIVRRAREGRRTLTQAAELIIEEQQRGRGRP